MLYIYLGCSWFHTSSILVAEVRKPPHVTQSNHIPRHSQKKLCFTAPVPSLLYLSFYSFHSTQFSHVSIDVQAALILPWWLVYCILVSFLVNSSLYKCVKLFIDRSSPAKLTTTVTIFKKQKRQVGKISK